MKKDGTTARRVVPVRGHARAKPSAEATPVPVATRAPGVAGCTRFVQRRVAARLPEIVEALLDRSREDPATLKALWLMGKLDEQGKTKAKRKGSLAREILREP